MEAEIFLKAADKEKANAWNFEIRFSNPHHHQSNSYAEKAVDILKNMLKKQQHKKFGESFNAIQKHH